MRILQVVHALPEARYGGTELYTQRLAEALAPDHEVAIATPRGAETDVEGATVHALPAPEGWADPTGVESGLESGVVHEAVDQRFVDLLGSFRPDVVHFQHLKFGSATLPLRCREQGVPSTLTLHDFWTVCHREQLHRPDGAFCSGPESVAKCTACYVDGLWRAAEDGGGSGGEPPVDDSTGGGEGGRLPKDVGEYALTVDRRTAVLDDAREALDLLISPSDFLRAQFLSFGTPPDRIVQCRNGIRTAQFADTGFDPDGPLVVGYAGRITHLKGIHLLVEAFEAVAGDAELHVFGAFDPESEPYHARLRAEAGPDVTFHGWYAEEDEPYRAMDVYVLPSLWYENSPLVVQEAFASRVPVVTSDIGGMAELVTDGRDGYTYPAGDAQALADRLQRLVDEPREVERLRRGIEPPKDIDEHADEVVALYGECRETHAVRLAEEESA